MLLKSKSKSEESNVAKNADADNDDDNLEGCNECNEVEYKNQEGNNE